MNPPMEFEQLSAEAQLLLTLAYSEPNFHSAFKVFGEIVGKHHFEWAQSELIKWMCEWRDYNKQLRAKRYAASSKARL